MKILVAHPTSFERVRRGTERLAEETAVCLASHGHDVTFLVCDPRPTRIYPRDGFRMIELRSLWRPWMMRLGVHEFMLFGLQVAAQLVRERFDVAYCYSFVAAAAAEMVGGRKRVPVVMVVNGLPPRGGGRLFRRAVRRASAVVAFSRFVQDRVSEWWGCPSVIIPAPVDLAQFPLVRGRDHRRPLILCTAALDDPRKGGPVLMRAFDRVKRQRPEVRLQIASRVPPELRRSLLSQVEPLFHPDIIFSGDGRREDLAGLYAQASVTVLPSILEAFGMVVIESMAAGTPVVGTRDGALPELISNPGIGRLFDPGPIVDGGATNDEGLALALLEAIDLGALPETAGLCRANAEKYSWEATGGLMNDLCRRLAGQAGDSVQCG
jgi:phosphatidyl-myo-inositol alpha-mannosyltransferase